MKFRKKPVVIEAVQYGPYTLPTLEMAMFLEGSGAISSNEGISIPTLKGMMLARVGDYIIKGVKGEFYPCKPDIFAATYEPADLAQAPAPVRVKPLEWENFDAWTYWARCPVGIYHVEERNGVWKATLDKNRGLELVYEYTTDGLTPDDFQAAQLAAQADYSARIRAALEAPDAGVVAELVEAANQARLAFAGYVAAQSAIDKLDAILAKLETRP